jgi:hypothetical protein
MTKMKKFLTVVVFFAALIAAVPAKAEVKFGLKGGLNLTSMSLDANALDKSNQAGFFIGPTFKFTLPVVGLGIDASALYDQREAKVEDNSIKQQSIQIPVNLRYGIGLGSTASIYFFAGPQFGFNVGDKNILTNVGNWSFNSSNVSANVGAGLMLLGHLQVSVNYNFGLGKTGEFDILNTNFKENGKLNAWQIAAAYYF